ncbi:MAG: YicC/YloC family endoribonuclease [Bryobacteraceae bacterium]
MTGFARVRRMLAEGEVALSVKSVNHRGLDLHFHLPAEMDPLEPALRAAVKGRLSRGHLQIHAALVPAADGAAAAALNEPMLAAYLAAFRKAQADHGLAGQPDLNTALRVPGILRAEARIELGPEAEAAIVEAMGEALGILDRFREREGAAIAADLRRRVEAITALTASMEEIRAGATQEYHKRLKERVRTLLRGAGIDPQRLAQEAAMLADRSDVSEELLRLRTHAAQVVAILDSGGETGKKLDFLLQEMNREANTILSKTSGLGDLGLKITELALAAKTEIDKIREQALNLE